MTTNEAIAEIKAQIRATENLAKKYRQQKGKPSAYLNAYIERLRLKLILAGNDPAHVKLALITKVLA